MNAFFTSLFTLIHSMPPGPDGLIEICQKLQSGISVHSMLHLLLKDLLLLSSLNGRTFRPSESLSDLSYLTSVLYKKLLVQCNSLSHPSYYCNSAQIWYAKENRTSRYLNVFYDLNPLLRLSPLSLIKGEADRLDIIITLENSLSVTNHRAGLGRGDTRWYRRRQRSSKEDWPK